MISRKQLFRYVCVGGGIGAALMGLTAPSTANEANFICWIFMFLACLAFAAKD
jgi:hypothetical protein